MFGHISDGAWNFACAVFITLLALGLWKTVEIIVWLATHVHIGLK